MPAQDPHGSCEHRRRDQIWAQAGKLGHRPPLRVWEHVALRIQPPALEDGLERPGSEPMPPRAQGQPMQHPVGVPRPTGLHRDWIPHSLRICHSLHQQEEDPDVRGRAIGYN